LVRIPKKCFGCSHEEFARGRRSLNEADTCTNVHYNYSEGGQEVVSFSLLTEDILIPLFFYV